MIDRMPKRFLYLAQGPGAMPAHYDDIESADADFVYLTFKNELPGAVFFPGSTWTTGRNRLLAEALQRVDNYEYFVFLDNDVSFIEGDWRVFERSVLALRPAIAAPYYADYPSGHRRRNSSSTARAQQCFYFDAIYTAFHRDVLKDHLIVPYYAGFDDISWWYSQYFVIQLAYIFYKGHVLQINDVAIGNEGHSPYPREDQFRMMSDWFETHVVKAPLRAMLPRNFRFRAERFLRGRLNLALPPRPPLASYRLDPARVRRKLHANDSNPFWKSFARHRQDGLLP